MKITAMARYYYMPVIPIIVSPSLLVVVVNSVVGPLTSFLFPGRVVVHKGRTTHATYHGSPFSPSPFSYCGHVISLFGEFFSPHIYATCTCPTTMVPTSLPLRRRHNNNSSMEKNAHACFLWFPFFPYPFLLRVNYDPYGILIESIPYLGSPLLFAPLAIVGR